MNLLLVDLSALFWRNWHATKDQEIGEAFALTIGKILKYRSQYDKCIVCCDLAPYKRKAISADYKSQRDAPDPVAVGQLKRVKERLTADGYPICEVQGYEADDIIATICDKFSSDESTVTIDILTADKDLMALVDDRVNVVHLATGDRFGPIDVTAKMGVPPELVSELLALTGDKSDNVPGCQSIGPKKAAQLLADNGGISGIIDRPESEVVATGATLAAVLANREAIRKSLALVTLMKDAPISIDELLAPREQKPLTEIDDAEFEEESEVEPEQTEPVKPAATTNAEHTTPVTPAQVTAPQSIQTVPIEQRIARATAPFELSLEPSTPGQAWALSKSIYSSRLYAVESPEAALMIVMTGREMGIPAMTSLRGFHFIKGKPSMSAQLMAALILRSGKAEYWEPIESSSKSATYVTKRIGGRGEQLRTFTVDDAKLAQLVKADSNWMKYPQAMCEARASAALARVVYPDLLMGVYLPDELEDES
jgi:5'-3' exonuclease